MQPSILCCAEIGRLREAGDMNEKPMTEKPMTEKRSWRSVVGELLIWIIVAVATAVILVLFSESLLPANF